MYPAAAAAGHGVHGPGDLARGQGDPPDLGRRPVVRLYPYLVLVLFFYYLLFFSFFFFLLVVLVFLFSLDGVVGERP